MNVCHCRRLAMLVVALLVWSSLALAAQTKGKPSKNANAAKPQAKTPAAKSKREAAEANSAASAMMRSSVAVP